MSGKRVAAQTELGVIRGRDSIHLKKLIQTDCPGILRISGDISTQLCSKYSGPPRNWVEVEIIFEGVLAYRAWSFDLYPDRLKKVSSMDKVERSGWPRELGLNSDQSTHFVLSTYDFIYEVLAKELVFKAGPDCP